jgi:hypothetical protein
MRFAVSKGVSVMRRPYWQDEQLDAEQVPHPPDPAAEAVPAAEKAEKSLRTSLPPHSGQRIFFFSLALRKSSSNVISQRSQRNS